ncbi:hypothetical protein LWI29_001435 [Acer saccharum]|uniref:Transposase MuDR plant domain-containing protein n=1 Tax=Acer saccharum TaxID=4024 RepID=A0AA39VU79_ACESA|nr:hypothetical protein LWI29_001435 [Acer saccharum]
MVFLVDDSSEDEKGNPKPVVRQRGKPYIESANGRVILEVGQMFNNLHHFRLILREYVVQEGFQLKMITNNKDMYTAECAYEGCSWRIHASPAAGKSAFMIKT